MEVLNWIRWSRRERSHVCLKLINSERNRSLLSPAEMRPAPPAVPSERTSGREMARQGTSATRSRATARATAMAAKASRRRGGNEDTALAQDEGAGVELEEVSWTMAGENTEDGGGKCKFP